MVKDILAIPEELEKVLYLISRASKMKVGEGMEKESLPLLLQCYSSFCVIERLAQMIPNFSTFVGIASLYFSESYEKKIIIELKEMLDEEYGKLGNLLLQMNKDFPKAFAEFSAKLLERFEDMAERRERLREVIGTSARIITAEDILKVSEILKEKYEFDFLLASKAKEVIIELVEKLKR
ncbi:MAG: hypothetical protein QW507_02565 [Candidatus Nanoarchaeia archaeon]|nr:hypothetical protein [Candidatus Haiyanarchaeum thermophilum]MCW1303305.1 hypothetical protein [Candidatus Haiyanarchaeum thermophilum]MCW1303963.1 hypothetical protein [Candidatus Haiyanarchaeum thermophilum]MCW1306464.1 hypothetical protein [Candidatus Haiyanarchaeum thermophilum]MCW1307238.1 hypothetical protein [Candidatus Haiyanarchaeum thermophilum]